MIGLWLVLAGAALALLAGLPAAVARHRTALLDRVGAAVWVLGSLLGLCGALLGALGRGGSATAAWSLPGGSLAVALDGLSAVFLVPVFLLPALAQVYALGYQAPGTQRGQRCCFGVLTGGMTLLLLAQNAVLFLIGWEAMALAAFLLIATEHQQAAARQAAWVYLVATHLGTACLIAAFVLLGGADGRLDWTGAGPLAVPAGRAVAVFLLALLGFGLKAGLMPLHVWLPAAHGNAPSHVSAILSGVMIAMGVYGFVRVLHLMPPLPAFCGALVLLLGAVTALLGVAATLGQGDLKRLLAYSSIENMGLVFIGVGLAVMGRAQGQQELVVLGLGGALLHVLNHSLFKPLLFFAAGSVLHATGTREMDQLGGLLPRMPRTGLCFLCGAGAIAGLPLLNGFVSEFVLYLGLFRAATAGPTATALAAAAALCAMALVSGLALLAFVRSSAAVFLGRARTAAAAAAHESPVAMTGPMVVLAVSCVLAGLVPWLPAAVVAPALALTLPGPGAGLRPALQAVVPFAALGLVALGCTGALLLGAVWVRRACRTRALRQVTTWDCGYADASSPRLQYSASSMAQLASSVLRRPDHGRASHGGPLPLFPDPRSFALRSREPLLHGVLWPLCRALADRCASLRILQRGKLQIYLLYILVVLCALLAWSALVDWSRP